ncbi:Rust resistance kinase Lr10 [Dichanthelium oligosanthes]|uniref:Rust resistance kinase Lr10 n=1 Tax=Dichanthelium oligosanthes TaxID=888268 RepID=A0A1E5V5K0_9POAL|nr:Rust resistance kinase Lr10 [Dichanthelium oligosanthes]
MPLLLFHVLLLAVSLAAPGGEGHTVGGQTLNSYPIDHRCFCPYVTSIGSCSSDIVSAISGGILLSLLISVCVMSRSKRALIYEYMPSASLERFTFGQSSEGKKSLSWEKLFDITVGIACGLEYLHRGCNTRIVHFDIKPHNILLDQDFCPKISDFGLAKLCIKKESIISIDGARGTVGYIAPEIFLQQFGGVSSKSDVYSYGMMVLEMVGERKNINKTSDASSKYFPQWIYDHLEEYCITAGAISVDIELVRKLIVVGLWCIQLQPNNRPSMTRVVEMLESRANDLQIPPQSLLC